MIRNHFMVVGAVLFAIVPSAGCFSGHPPYPNTWPELRTSVKESCERVAGTYRSPGERGQWMGRLVLGSKPEHPQDNGRAQHYPPIEITELLFPQGSPTEADTVTFSFPEPGRLNLVAATGSERSAWTLFRASGHFKCDGSTLVLDRPSDWQRGFAPIGMLPTPFVGKTSEDLKLDLVEGYLYVTKRMVDVMLVPVPIRSTWSSWYRFERIEPQTDRWERDPARAAMGIPDECKSWQCVPDVLSYM